MRRILVTGSGGIVGGHVIDLLGASDHHVDVVRFKGDLADVSQTKAFVDAAGPLDGVIHLGAVVAVDQVQADPARAYSVNVGGTVHLLGALAQCAQSPHFLHCSSAHVYAPQSTAIDEDAATEPHSLYGRTKLMAEIAAKDVCEVHDIPLCIGRVFSIHDPRQTGTYLRPNILRRLNEENLDLPFDLYGADSVRDFLTARQAADVIVDLALRRFEGVINIGSGVGTKIRHFVQDLASRPLNINGLGGQDCLLADTKKLTALQEV